MSFKKEILEINADPSAFFLEMVNYAIDQRKLKTHSAVNSYLAKLLEQYMVAENLNQQTLAELYLTATSADGKQKIDLLKRLGDSALYISGFFGDSLQRKVVDVDYYVNMGGSAYATLSGCVPDQSSFVFKEISMKFVNFVDVLNYISDKTAGDSNRNILRLYEKYIKTGSELARDQIIEKGLALPDVNIKISKQ